MHIHSMYVCTYKLRYFVLALVTGRDPLRGEEETPPREGVHPVGFSRGFRLSLERAIENPPGGYFALGGDSFGSRAQHEPSGGPSCPA